LRKINRSDAPVGILSGRIALRHRGGAPSGAKSDGGPAGWLGRLRRAVGYVSNLPHFAGLGAPRVPPEIEV